MKNKIFISFLCCFVILVIGICLILLAVKDRAIPMMYAGLALLITSCLGYSILFLISLRRWLMERGK